MFFSPSPSVFFFCTGELKHVLKKHQGPIFSLKWNKKGDLLLSGSVDKTAIIWDTSRAESRQQFEFHAGLLYIQCIYIYIAIFFNLFFISFSLASFFAIY